VRFSVWPDNERPWPEILDIVRHCERVGWDGAYCADHFMPNDEAGRPVDGPVLECWATVAGLAASTSQLRIGTLVCGNLYRHPAIVANAAIGVDHVSGGRFVLGVGAGWQINEHAAYGIDLLDIRTRLDRFEEACAVIRSLLDDPRTTFEGRHYRVVDAPCDPKPVQHRLPLLIGGGGEQRTLRIVARFADEWNAWCTPEQFRRKSDLLDEYCVAIGRDPATIRRSTQAMLFVSHDERAMAEVRATPSARPRLIGTPSQVAEQVAAYDAVGVDELVIPDWTFGSLAMATDTLDLFWQDVAGEFRRAGV
jgi:F420-dependent oxidoreductase-like protein